MKEKAKFEKVGGQWVRVGDKPTEAKKEEQPPEVIINQPIKAKNNKLTGRKFYICVVGGVVLPELHLSLTSAGLVLGITPRTANQGAQKYRKGEIVCVSVM